jgi:hypothetical protein
VTGDRFAANVETEQQMQAPSKFIGWKLGEAIRRTSAQESLRGYAAALRASRKRRAKLSRSSTYMIGRQDFEADVRTQEQENLAVSLARREQELKSSLLAMLKQGWLVAYGRLESVMADQKIIQPSAWDMLGIKSAKKSAVVEETRSKAEIVDVRIFPVVEAPDGIDFLSGLTLIEAFDRYIFNDPQRLALASCAAEGGGKPLARSFEARLYGALWPVDFGNCLFSPMGRAMMAAQYRDLKARTGAICLSADRVLSDRFGRLIGYLSSGSLVAHGLSPSSGVITPIPRALWHDNRINLDLENGSLLEYVPNESPESRMPYRRLFLAVTLTKPESSVAMLHVKPIEYEQSPLIAAEHAPALNESKSISRVRARDDAEQKCRQWLVGLMHESPNERKQTVLELWVQARKEWPNLTRKAYQRARVDAVREAHAPTWSASGAPRKSDRKGSKNSPTSPAKNPRH